MLNIKELSDTLPFIDGVVCVGIEDERIKKLLHKMEKEAFKDKNEALKIKKRKRR